MSNRINSNKVNSLYYKLIDLLTQIIMFVCPLIGHNILVVLFFSKIKHIGRNIHNE